LELAWRIHVNGRGMTAAIVEAAFRKEMLT